MTLLVPRGILGAIFGILVVLMVNLSLIGHDRTKPMADGCRKWIVRRVYLFWAHSISLLIYWTWIRYEYVSEEQVNHYQEYLGTKEEQGAEQAKPDVDEETGLSRRVPKRGPGKCSTIVSNHVGFMEIIALICTPLNPAFAARIGVSKMPVMNKLTDGLESIYIDKSDSVQRVKALEILKERAV